MVSTVTPIPDPPTPSDSPSEFDRKAYAAWAGLKISIPEMNTLGGEIQTIGNSASSSATSAQEHAASAYSNAQSSGVSEANAKTYSETATAASATAVVAKNDAVTAKDQAVAAAADAQNRVPMTGSTGAAIVPSGTTAERPSIPASGWLQRFNTTLGLGEFYNRAASAWDYFVSNRLFNESIGEIIIYPNGGSEASPASVTTNSRYVMANPYPGRNVICVAEVLHNGVWGDTGWYTYDTGVGQAYGSFGVRAAQLADEVVVKTALRGLLSENAGSPHTSIPPSGVTSPLPCRVKVWKVKGVS